MEIQNNKGINNEDSMASIQIEPFKHSWTNLLFLRPYGEANLTPKVTFWIASSWTVIFMMAGLEGTVWGLISRHLVPSAYDGLKLPVAVFAFLFVFCLIWITDASLIMFRRKHHDQNNKPFWGTDRFIWGIVFRVGIVAISLFITAPFLNQAIREDDIAKELEADKKNIRGEFLHKKELEKNQRIRELQQQLTNIQKGIEQSQETQKLNSEAIDALNNDIDVQNKEVVRTTNEINRQLKGLNGERPGKGNKYRKAISDRDAAVKKLRQDQDARSKFTSESVPLRSNSFTETTENINQEIKEAADTYEKVKNEVESLSIEDFASQYAKELSQKFPENSLGNRIQVLDKIKQRENIPHLQSTEGLAQALLGLLFFSLLAIKLFESDEVQLYFNEEYQETWKRYNLGLLDKLPDFALIDGPRMAYPELVKQWTKYEHNPDRYWELYNEKLIRRYKIEELRTELELRSNDQNERAERSKIQLEALKGQLEQELRLNETEKQQALENIKRESALRLEQLEQEFENKKSSLAYEIDQKKKQREHERDKEDRLEKYKIERQERLDKIKFLEEEIERIEIEKSNINSEIKKYNQELEEAYKAIKQFEGQINNAKLEPEERKKHIIDLKRRIKNTQDTLSEYNEHGAEDNVIAQTKHLFKQLSNERKEAEKLLHQSTDKLTEPTRKLKETEIRIGELKIKIHNLKDQLHTIEKKSDEWREKRYDLFKP